MYVFSAISVALCLSFKSGVGSPVPSQSPPLPYVLRNTEAPYVVVVVTGGAVCSGALVQPRWVLTAAHCVFRANISSIRVFAGSVNASFAQSSEEFQKHLVDLVLVHPSYNGSWANHDVALVRLYERLRLINIARTIQVSSEPWGGAARKHCQVPGYGVLQKSSSSSLDKRLKVHMLNISRPCPCERQMIAEKGKERVQRWLCSELTPHSGPCRGDSGSPLVCGPPEAPRVWGLTSATFFVGDPSTCNITRYPDQGEDECGSFHLLNIFIDIHPYFAWIQATTSVSSRASLSYCLVAVGCSYALLNVKF